MSLEQSIERMHILACIEALIFASGSPLPFDAILAALERAFENETPEFKAMLSTELPGMLEELMQTFSPEQQGRGFMLCHIDGAYVFRTMPRYAHVVRALKAPKPQRLSRAALETLSIVAYRQPVSKPDIDHIRGVDCSGTLRVLIDHQLVRMVGRAEDVGRPLLYGTTREFLSFFNLEQLSQLPSLRDFTELNEESAQELREFDGEPSFQELSQAAKQLRLDDEPAVQELDEAVRSLMLQEIETRDALVAEGIVLADTPTEEPAQEAAAG